MLEGNKPPPVRSYFFRARLIALDKRGGGVRPIAIGCVLRRLVAKLACFRVSEDMAEVFSPLQLGFGVKGGIKAAVHAGRHFLDSLSPDEAVVKLDFRNAFNSMRRDRMLHSVLSVCPAIFPLVFSAYSASSSLFWEDQILLSSEGVQQGDPLGPLLFCIRATLHHFLVLLRSLFRVAYLDDVTLGGSVASLCNDISTLKGAEDIGLFLNPLKSEVISNCSDAIESIHSVLPGAVVVSPDSCYLLGSPIGNSSTLSSAIDQKVSALKLMGERLSLFSLHDSMLLLHSSFSIPRLMFILRTSPLFHVDALKEYDVVLCSLLSSLLNVAIDPSNSSWSQASLPVRLGGLGFRSAVQLAPSCYLSSAAASRGLVTLILSNSTATYTSRFCDEALARWSDPFPSLTPPVDGRETVQKEWDHLQAGATFDHLLNSAPNDGARARLLAVSAPESGAWLHALPISSLGL